MSDHNLRLLGRIWFQASNVWLFVLGLSFWDIHPMSSVCEAAAAYSIGGIIYGIFNWERQ